MRDHPIAPVTDPMQYRAIGLVRGIYKPENPEQITRGTLTDNKGVQIESVVLGRVLTLMKRHISMEKPHLWVVYPRCRNVETLHLQIAGIWEPSTLGSEENSNNQKEVNLTYSDEIIEGDDYFSVRGELIYTKPEDNDLIVKIRQKPRKKMKKTMPFKIRLKGNIPLSNLHNFISFDARRIGQEIIMEDYNLIAPISKKSSKK